MADKSHYEVHAGDGDQKPHPTKEDEHTGPRFDEGKENSHKIEDNKDARSVQARAGDEKLADKRDAQAEAEKNIHQTNPVAIAESHGNKPSKGAKVDQSLVDDEEEELRKKDEAKAQSKAAHK